MADGTPASSDEKLHLDEVTGERVSKTELKKRQKQRERDAKKAEKASKAPPVLVENPQNAVKEEQQLNPNQYFEIRSRQVDKLRTNRGPDDPSPYPHKLQVTGRVPDFIEHYQSFGKGQTDQSIEVTLAGRIWSMRIASSKLRFYEMESEGAVLQVMCQAQNSDSEVSFEDQHKYLRRGDWIVVRGFGGRTNPEKRDVGELSIFARHVTLACPCLHLLPNTAEQSSGFRDPEERFRQRFLDFMINIKKRRTIEIRDDVMFYIRSFFREKRFREVETPMMNAIAGGATAKPFKTYHNDHKQDMFMRIAPELYLKELIVGGFDAVYEMGRQFRNEGADLTHNPEFTSVEAYKAFWDVYDVENMTEELVSGLVKEVLGTLQTTYHTLSGEELHIDWSTPWKRVEIIPTLERETGQQFPPATEFHTEDTNKFLKALLKEKNIECTPPMTNTRMFDKLIGHYIEDHCINPTFITGHPQVMSPLAKAHRDKPGLCERSEAFVARKEIANMYTELNDPFDQRLRFEEQARQKAAGDEEAQGIDEPFCRALELGLPPTGGWGLGLDRLIMFLCDEHSIREVLAFPFMKDDGSGRDKKTAAEEVGVQPMDEAGVPIVTMRPGHGR